MVDHQIKVFVKIFEFRSTNLIETGFPAEFYIVCISQFSMNLIGQIKIEAKGLFKYLEISQWVGH
jgi:hypothetical protein